MTTALWTASTGMQAAMTGLEVVANNLANSSTVGFKKSRADFQDLLYQSLAAAGEATSGETTDPVGEQVGTGTQLGSITKEHSQGSLSRTDRELDVAIMGKGFVPLTNIDGTTVYTRDGSFKLDQTGQIVNSDGLPVEGLGAVPQNARAVNFAKTGQVSYIDETGVENTIGSLQLALFLNPSGLTAKGGNLYEESPASGTATLTAPGSTGAGTLQQRFLETSNVSVVEEMVNLIATQRSYEINAKMIKATDETLATANQIAS